MANLKTLMIMILALPVSLSFAQTAIKIDAGPYSTVIERGQKREIPWNDMIGRVVDVDGLTWGALEKGLGSHLVLPRGKVYLRRESTEENGRLVRVTGVLRKSRVEPAPKRAQGYSQPFEYFHIDVMQSSRIEKLELDQLLPSRDDWIIPGLSAEDVARMIRSRGLTEYPLALRASKDGSTTKSYSVSEGVVLVYRLLDGRVASLSKINLHNPGKIDDERVALTEFMLPPAASNAR